MSKQTYKVCFCFRRRYRHTASVAPPEIKTIFDDYSDKGLMTVDHLLRFLTDVQKQEQATREEAQAIVNASSSLLHRNGLHLDAFFKYLLSVNNSPLAFHEVHQDMDAPLSHYFIFTGHNSYLTGNQLSSDCSEIPIIDALKRGVRVIELDLWPNSDEDGIDVLHGRTLTSPVELSRCLNAIQTYAFDVSDYPVVVTLEDHLTPKLQAKVAEMVSEVFGETLFTPPPGECLKEFPSPASLKKRIIISTKPPKEYKESKDDEAVEKKDRSLGDEEVWGREVPIFSRRVTSDDKNDSNDDDDDDDDDEGDKFKKNAPPQYKNLIAIQAGKPKGGMVECLKVDLDKVRRLSLSEEQLEKASEKYAKQIVSFTQRNMLRIYPKGTRITSSNYNPLVGWSHGAQMVAFNMQGQGRSLWVMQGMFRANGGCGYIKKPDILLKSGTVFDPEATLPVKTTLRVTIYMGEGWYYDFPHTHFDRYSPPDFYARVGIAGVTADTVMRKTKMLEDNWIPAWNEVFEFPLTVPELALLRIEVHEYDMSEKDDFGGQTCLPVWELRQGIRVVPLHNQDGVKCRSVKLLVRLEFV
ncbi:Phosphoinositide phospholipase C 7 [Raphanus sativus]|uniref:Phosphoinositide phospholipase C n=1 Tax=Raphanus sativus TaxID=3726 RepID=A0A9W3DQE2_RAPSA|nr:phosphoinositide phospholipase C 7 [Raphanus sativus]KAJ4895934.1 Phosphoinositide phospholipase C 7 [Raphanus sativus]